jgi:nucleoid DNA-binding protein
MLDKPPQSDITTSSKRSSEAAEAHGILAAVLQGLSAIYASAAKVTLEGFVDLADGRAERRAERLARRPQRGAVTSGESNRPVIAPPSTVSAPKRTSKSR